MRYFGGKNQSGVYQRIINRIPPHRRYFELFLGSGAVYRYKLSAAKSFLADMDWRSVVAGNDYRRRRDPIAVVDALDFMDRCSFREDDFVYLDPPYLWSTRLSNHRYRYELGSCSHRRLLDIVFGLNCMVLISHPDAELYSSTLSGWNRYQYTVVDRGGNLRQEFLWYNYPPPVKLHDYRYVGVNRTDRQRIKRKVLRTMQRLASTPAMERNCILTSIADEYGYGGPGEHEL